MISQSPSQTTAAAQSPPPKPPEPTPNVPVHVGFNCRVCNARLFALTRNVGQNQKCGECGALNTIPPPPPPKAKNMPAALEGEQYELWDADNQPLPSQLIASQPKTVLLQCRRCDTVMHPEVRLVGQPIRCPDCGSTNIVPPPPRPIVRKSVLASDATTPQLDPAADPGERPYVPPPQGNMLFEDEQEDEYRRALEKSQRTGNSMEVDHRGRPIMPRWPLLTGIIPFLFSRGVLARWAGFSVLAIIYDALGWFIHSAATSPGGIFSLGLIGALVIGLSAVGFVLLPFWLAGLSSIFFTIVTESSEGNATVKSWPSANIMERFPQLFYLVIAIPLSIGAGSQFARFVHHDPILFVTCIAVGVVLLFPIIVLSQLDNGSPLSFLSFRVVRSLITCPFSWLLFYMETAAIFAICGMTAYLARSSQAALSLLLIPLLVMSVFLYARLLGRLGWRLAEVILIEDRPA